MAPIRSVVCVALAVWLLLAGGCSSSSGPKEPRRTVLKDYYGEHRIGSDVAKQFADHIGLIADAELDAYLNGLGQKLLATMPRVRFEYSFEVINMVEPNALVLPGGFVYVSRGLLALTNNEDELACVLGHEIVHAENSHAVQRQALDDSASPLMRTWQRAARRAGFSREMEEEADRVGQRLCAAAGYDPMGMSTLFTSLQRAERLRFGFTREPTFFDTHPGSAERAAVNASRAGKLVWQRDPSIGDPRESLLRQIDGIDVGQRPQSGVFVGHRFLHPVLDFQISFPGDWQVSVTNRVVGAVSPDSGTVVFLTIDQPAGDPKTRAEEWFEDLDDDSIRVDRGYPVQVRSLPAWRLELSTTSRWNRGGGVVTFFTWGESTYRIVGVAPNRSARQHLPRTLTATRSFRPLSAENRATIQAHRLRVVKAEPGETLVALGEREGGTWPITRRALQNGFFSDHVFEGGELVKISRAESYALEAP